MKLQLSSIQVVGIHAVLPPRTKGYEAWGQQFGVDEVARIIKSTGIEQVHIAEHHHLITDYAEQAANHLMEALNMSAQDIDGVVMVSQTPDRVMPATSVVLQHRLGLSTDVVAFDISYGCSGYIYGLLQAALLLATGACQRVLLCSGDLISRSIDPQDRATQMVFGDAVAATIIEVGQGQMAFELYSDGSGAGDLFLNRPKDRTTPAPYLSMNGQAIMQFALNRIPPLVDSLLDDCGWSKDELGSLWLHQANALMLHYLRRAMHFKPEMVPITMSQTGNTGPASIPLALCQQGHRLQQSSCLNQTILCGFGVGLSWGAVALDLSKTCLVLPEVFVS